MQQGSVLTVLSAAHSFAAGSESVTAVAGSVAAAVLPVVAAGFEVGLAPEADNKNTGLHGNISLQNMLFMI